MKNSNIPNHIVTMAKNVAHINRIESLKKYGFTEQNNIARYQQKLSGNVLAQTVINAKTLARKAENFRLFVDRCVGLA